MSLCAKCYEKWKEAADQMEVKDDLNNFPWTHCHHEEDKEEYEITATVELIKEKTIE